MLDRPGTPKCIVIVCWKHMAKAVVWEIFDNYLQQNSVEFQARLETLSVNAPCFRSPLLRLLQGAVAAMWLLTIMVVIPEPDGGHQW